MEGKIDISTGEGLALYEMRALVGLASEETRSKITEGLAERNIKNRCFRFIFDYAKKIKNYSTLTKHDIRKINKEIKKFLEQIGRHDLKEKYLLDEKKAKVLVKKASMPDIDADFYVVNCQNTEYDSKINISGIDDEEFNRYQDEIEKLQDEYPLTAKSHSSQQINDEKIDKFIENLYSGLISLYRQEKSNDTILDTIQKEESNIIDEMEHALKNNHSVLFNYILGAAINKIRVAMPEKKKNILDKVQSQLGYSEQMYNEAESNQEYIEWRKKGFFDGEKYFEILKKTKDALTQLVDDIYNGRITIHRKELERQKIENLKKFKEQIKNTIIYQCLNPKFRDAEILDGDTIQKYVEEITRGSIFAGKLKNINDVDSFKKQTGIILKKELEGLLPNNKKDDIDYLFSGRVKNILDPIRKELIKKIEDIYRKIPEKTTRKTTSKNTDFLNEDLKNAVITYDNRETLELYQLINLVGKFNEIDSILSRRDKYMEKLEQAERGGKPAPVNVETIDQMLANGNEAKIEESIRYVKPKKRVTVNRTDKKELASEILTTIEAINEFYNCIQNGKIVIDGKEIFELNLSQANFSIKIQEINVLKNKIKSDELDLTLLKANVEKLLNEMLKDIHEKIKYEISLLNAKIETAFKNGYSLFNKENVKGIIAKLTEINDSLLKVNNQNLDNEYLGIVGKIARINEEIYTLTKSIDEYYKEMEEEQQRRINPINPPEPKPQSSPVQPIQHPSRPTPTPEEIQEQQKLKQMQNEIIEMLEGAKYVYSEKMLADYKLIINSCKNQEKCKTWKEKFNTDILTRKKCIENCKESLRSIKENESYYKGLKNDESIKDMVSSIEENTLNYKKTSELIEFEKILIKHKKISQLHAECIKIWNEIHTKPAYQRVQGKFEGPDLLTYWKENGPESLRDKLLSQKAEVEQIEKDEARKQKDNEELYKAKNKLNTLIQELQVNAATYSLTMPNGIAEGHEALQNDSIEDINNAIQKLIVEKTNQQSIINNANMNRDRLISQCKNLINTNRTYHVIKKYYTAYLDECFSYIQPAKVASVIYNNELGNMKFNLENLSRVGSLYNELVNLEKQNQKYPKVREYIANEKMSIEEHIQVYVKNPYFLEQKLYEISNKISTETTQIESRAKASKLPVPPEDRNDSRENTGPSTGNSNIRKTRIVHGASHRKHGGQNPGVIHTKRNHKMGLGLDSR